MFKVMTKGQADWNTFDTTNGSNLGTIGLCLFLLYST